MKWILAALVGAAAVWGLARASGAQGGGGCHAPDAFSARGVGYLQSFVTSTDSSDVALRRRLNVDAVAPVQVFQVQVDAVCTQAARSRATEEDLAYDDAPAYVYQMGTQYVVDAPVIAGWQPMHVQDALFRHVGWLSR